MSDTQVLYCQASPNQTSSDTQLPGESLLLTWLCKFLHVHHPQSTAKPLFKIVLTDKGSQSIGSGDHMTISCKHAEPIDYTQLPAECQRVMLPCSGKSENLIRSGVTSLSRWMILTYHRAFPDYGYNHLLGYKETCFKACAEVSKWTMFVTTNLVPLITDQSDSADYEMLLVETLNHLESKLTTKQPVSAYKHNYFKKGADGSLRHVYHSLHNRDVKENFLAGHLPNLIDILCYITLQALQSRCVLEKYPDIKKWCSLMESLAGVTDTSHSLGLSNQTTDVSELAQRLSNISLPSHSHHSECGTDSLSTKSHDKTPQTAEAANKSHVIDTNNDSLDDDSIKLTDADLVEKLKEHYNIDVPYTDLSPLDWDDLPYELDPARGGKLPMKRAVKKRQQLDNMYHHIKQCILARHNKPGGVVVDFCAGGGHVGLLVAHLHPDIKVHLVENKEESLSNASDNITSLGLGNVTMYQCNLTQYFGSFDIGATLHACGLATDLVIDKCVTSQAAMVISPCCYGTIHSKDSITMPRSEGFQSLVNREGPMSLIAVLLNWLQPHLSSDMPINLIEDGCNKLTFTQLQEMILLRHSSDKTERGIDQQSLGKECMVLSDVDRRVYISQHYKYKAAISLMYPETCSPKNHIITLYQVS